MFNGFCACFIAFFAQVHCMGYYNEISQGYDELHLGEQRKKAQLIKQNCALHGLLLDVGAGTGSATELFRDKAECIALDPAIEMLKKFSGLKVCACAEHIPLKDNCFDSIVSLTALHHCDLEKAFSEIKRVAKPNAVIAISFFRRASNFPLAEKLFSGFRKLDAGVDCLFLSK